MSAALCRRCTLVGSGNLVHNLGAIQWGADGAPWPMATQLFDITPSEIEEWVEESRREMENALRTKPPEVREECERQLEEPPQVYGDAMLELRARKTFQSLLGEDEK